MTVVASSPFCAEERSSVSRDQARLPASSGRTDLRGGARLGWVAVPRRHARASRFAPTTPVKPCAFPRLPPPSWWWWEPGVWRRDRRGRDLPGLPAARALPFRGGAGRGAPRGASRSQPGATGDLSPAVAVSSRRAPAPRSAPQPPPKASARRAKPAPEPVRRRGDASLCTAPPPGRIGAPIVLSIRARSPFQPAAARRGPPRGRLNPRLPRPSRTRFLARASSPRWPRRSRRPRRPRVAEVRARAMGSMRTRIGAEAEAWNQRFLHRRRALPALRGASSRATRDWLSRTPSLDASHLAVEDRAAPLRFPSAARVYLREGGRTRTGFIDLRGETSSPADGRG